MQTILMTLLALCITWSASAQLGWTQAEIKNDRGIPSENGYTTDGKNWFISYSKNIYTKQSGSYVQAKVYYFLKNNTD
ncbi:MAG: hypothetical protein GY810_10190, partial [Aureispira sp.]|nr:hypothetical protein [Aureispira sp.]